MERDEEAWAPHSGRVAVASDGRIFVVADRPSVRGPFGVFDPVVVAFDPDGGAPLWTWSEWLQSTNLGLEPRDIVVDAEGRVAALFFVEHGGPHSAHFLLRVFDPDGRVVRVFDSATLDHGGGEQAGALVADPDGRLVVLARRFGSEAGDASGGTLVLGFDAQGEIVCDETLDEPLGWIAGASMDGSGDMLVVGSEFTSTNESDGTFGRIRGFDPAR